VRVRTPGPGRLELRLAARGVSRPLAVRTVVVRGRTATVALRLPRAARARRGLRLDARFRARDGRRSAARLQVA
jgi:hypothetical protein